MLRWRLIWGCHCSVSSIHFTSSTRTSTTTVVLYVYICRYLVLLLGPYPVFVHSDPNSLIMFSENISIHFEDIIDDHWPMIFIESLFDLFSFWFLKIWEDFHVRNYLLNVLKHWHCFCTKINNESRLRYISLDHCVLLTLFIEPAFFVQRVMPPKDYFFLLHDINLISCYF